MVVTIAAAFPHAPICHVKIKKKTFLSDAALDDIRNWCSEQGFKMKGEYIEDGFEYVLKVTMSEDLGEDTLFMLRWFKSR